MCPLLVKFRVSWQAKRAKDTIKGLEIKVKVKVNVNVKVKVKVKVL